MVSLFQNCWAMTAFIGFQGGGPRVVVSTAAFHARVRGSVPGFGGLKETKNVSYHLRVLLVQFSLYVHKGGLKPDSFHFISLAFKHFSPRSLPLFCRPKRSSTDEVQILYSPAMGIKSRFLWATPHLFNRHGTNWTACRSGPWVHSGCSAEWSWQELFYHVPLHERTTVYMNAIRSADGKIFETFWNAFQRSVQKVIFHERGWDVGQRRLAVMRQGLRPKESTIQLLRGWGAGCSFLTRKIIHFTSCWTGHLSDTSFRAVTGDLVS